ncbi:hypothetical protein SM124_14180 [Bacillus sp. 31A1R]|uniref:Uncharacterized protein n=1 Tax=Robertmurraya mangrovi TaxID=3098077 RepID=A0ABU5J0J2_9BACI|nr:hypothetical protein [Bacillus sp. 31A1R]MDZ5472877.1 hypothetical protein [Bacillus sp. 31A1R]
MDLKKMRVKQVATTNVLLIMSVTLYFTIISIFNITISQFFFVFGVITLLQAVYTFLKRSSTKSIIPIYEQVAIYEKEKMGKEWKKQRKSNSLWNLFLSGLMFFNFFINRGSTDVMFQFDLGFILILVISVLFMVNLSLFLHIRKVDQARTADDLKGYTKELNVKGVIIGSIFAVVIIIITIVIIMNTI